LKNKSMLVLCWTKKSQVFTFMKLFPWSLVKILKLKFCKYNWSFKFYTTLVIFLYKIWNEKSSLTNLMISWSWMGFKHLRCDVSSGYHPRMGLCKLSLRFSCVVTCKGSCKVQSQNSC
jgi:hypothetical protein